MALAAAGASAAQDPPAAEALLRSCLGAAEPEGEDVCRGVYARQCAAAAPEGESTTGLSACTAAETDGWDRLLNEHYADLVVLSRRRAAAEGDGTASAPLEDMLREAQRSWIAFRDADCEHEHAIWGTGSQRQVAGGVCLLQRTATRVFELRAKLNQMQAE